MAVSYPTDREFHEKVNAAIVFTENRKSERDKCPACHEKLALMSLSFRNCCVARLCRFCKFKSFTTGVLVKKKKTHAKVTSLRKAG